MHNIITFLSSVFSYIEHSVHIAILKMHAVNTKKIKYNTVYDMYAVVHDLHNDSTSEMFLYDKVKFISIKQHKLELKCLTLKEFMKIYVSNTGKAEFSFIDTAYEFIFVKSKT